MSLHLFMGEGLKPRKLCSTPLYTATADPFAEKCYWQQQGQCHRIWELSLGIYLGATDWLGRRTSLLTLRKARLVSILKLKRWGCPLAEEQRLGCRDLDQVWQSFEAIQVCRRSILIQLVLVLSRARMSEKLNFLITYRSRLWAMPQLNSQKDL